VPSFPDDTIAAIKQAVDIVELVGEYLPLKKAGRSYKGLCPFHDDHNPSLSVNPDRQSFRCWSCGEAGDVISFVMARERVEFPEAVRVLAQRAGVAIQETTGQKTERSQRSQLRDVLAWAEVEFQRCLLASPEGQPARDYLAARSISAESIGRFRLGYAPNDWDWLLNRSANTQIATRLLEEAGLVTPRPSGTGHYDRFRGRVMFPIHDVRGRCVAFGGRILPHLESDTNPKYLNSPETPLFNKSRQLYGLHLARDGMAQTGRAVLVEGYTDCIMAHQCGVAHVVGTLGTALTPGHVTELRRFAETVILVFDGDEAGIKAADRGLELFVTQQVDLRLLTLPDALDPCDFLLQRGGGTFQEALEQAVDALEYKLNRGRLLFDLASIDGRQRALDYVLEVLAAIPAAPGAAAQVKRDLALARLAEQLGLSESLVRRRMAELRKRSRTEAPAPGPTAAGLPSRTIAGRPSTPQTDAADPALDPLERELIEIILGEPSYVETVLEAVGPDEIATPELRSILAACRELWSEGVRPNYTRLTARLQDRRLVRIVTVLDELGRAKGHWARRLRDVLGRLQLRSHAAELPRWKARLHEVQGADEAEEVRLLELAHQAHVMKQKTSKLLNQS